MSNESREFSMVRELAKIACLRKISMCIFYSYRAVTDRMSYVVSTFVFIVREQAQLSCLMKVSTGLFYS